MRRPLTITFLLIITFTQFSCGKKNSPGSSADDDLRIDDRMAVRLKEVTEAGSPNPLFRFQYNDSGLVTHISYAGGFFDYELQYSNKKLVRMINTPDGARLSYQYHNGLVSAIKRTDAEGHSRWIYVFDYEAGRLSSVKWYRFETEGDSILERQAVLSYGLDGNLSVYKDYWRTDNPELSLTRTLVYKNYDNKTNVDDFYLMKTFFEDVLFLPGIRLQKNNPGIVEIKGLHNDYEINYSYTYSNGWPLEKKGLFRQTRGGGSGSQIEQLTRFSYQ